MYIIYNKEKIFVKNCYTFVDRLKGNMFKKEIKQGLLFDKCNSIHTFFVRKKLDIIFLDKKNKVLKIYYQVKPNKIIRVKNAKKVLELPANTLKKDFPILKLNFNQSIQKQNQEF